MQTPVDYSMSSNVWASDKWKGVLKVRWIYIKDVPLSALRHIRLSNTPENKPVTSSRDTQEVPYEAGLEVLRIIANYQNRTSLLQDYAWYEAQFRRNQEHAPAGAGVDAQVQPGEPIPPQPAPHYGNPASSSAHGGGGPSQETAPKAPRQQQQPGQAQGQQQGGRRFWNRGAGGGPMANPGGAPPSNGGMSRASPGLPPPQQQQPPYGQPPQYQQYHQQQHPSPMPQGPPPALHQSYYAAPHPHQQHNGGPY